MASSIDFGLFYERPHLVSSPNPYGYSPNSITPKVNFGWISEAFNIFRQGAGPWLILYICAGALFMAFYGILAVIDPGIADSNRSSSNMSPAGVGILLGFYPLSFLVGAIVAACSADIAIRQVRRETVLAGQAFRGAAKIFPVMGYLLIAGVACMLGALGLCVGIFIVGGLLLPSVAMVADGEPVIGAISKGMKAMSRDWLNAGLFMFVFYLLTWFGSTFTCGLASLVIYPMYFIITALAYRDIGGMPNVPPPGMPAWFPPQVQQPGVWPPPPGYQNPQPWQQPPYGQQAGQFGQSPFGQPNPPQFGQTPDDSAGPPSSPL